MPAARRQGKPSQQQAKPVRVGVLALQGDVAEHLQLVEVCGGTAVPVRTGASLEQVDALILPGGESTTLTKLLDRAGMTGVLRERAAGGMPLYCTCAGMILMAREIAGHPEQSRLGLVDVTVARNAYGRQVDSFEVDLDVPALGEEPLRAVFIRAPRIQEVGPGVEVLATYNGAPVWVRQGVHLVSAFHPEIAGDPRLHGYFLDLVRASSETAAPSGSGADAPARPGPARPPE